MSGLDKRQQDLSKYIHLANALQPHGFLNTMAMAMQEQQPGEIDNLAQDGLNFIAACLAIGTDDHLAVTDSGNGQVLVIAKAGPVGEQDKDRAEAVFATLRKISDHRIEQALVAVIEQDFGHALFLQQAQELEESLSQKLASRLKDIAPAAYQNQSDANRFLSSIDKLWSCASQLNSAGKMSRECWMTLYKLATKDLAARRLPKLDPADGLSHPFISLHNFLESFLRWPTAISWLAKQSKYLKPTNVNAFNYRFISTMIGPGHVDLNFDLLTTLHQIVSDRGLLNGRYKRFWSKLIAEFNLEDNQTFSPFLAVHPEVKLILDIDQGSHRNFPTHPRPIGSYAGPCACCAIWIRHYNENVNTAWVCGDHESVGTDWAAPLNTYSRGLDLKILDKVNETLLIEVKKALFDLVQKELEDMDDASSTEFNDEEDVANV